MLLFLLAKSDVDGPGPGHAPDLGRTSYEDVITCCRALSCRYPGNCVAVWPRRSGNVASRTKLHASRHHGRGAKASDEATQAGAGSNHKCRPPESAGRREARSNSHSDATACAGFGPGEA